MKDVARVSMLLVVLLFPALARAESDSDADEEVEYENVWSTTLITDFKIIEDPWDHDDRTGFFDQYEFTPNKGTSLPVELGVRRLAFDRFGPGETPQWQLRLSSPTSNLGISGSQIDEPFFNQHADLYGRFDGLALDMEYWRLRTEELRLFPNTQGRQFEDLTRPDDRFDRDRTGFLADLRLRPTALKQEAPEAVQWLRPELSLRGGYDDRDGSQQLRFIQNQSTRWGQVKEPMHQGLGEAGGGLLLAPGGLFNLTLDVDYERFRQRSSTILDSDLQNGFLPGNRTVGFVPDTDRITGTVRAQTRIGEQAVLEGGFQISRLEQVGDTPRQDAAGLDHNELLFYSLNASADWNATEDISLNAFLKYDQRKNDIDRDTVLFNPVVDGAQSSPFLKRWDRVYAGVEGAYALHRGNRVAAGLRYEWLDRDLEYALPTNLTVLKPNARVRDRTETWTLYGRTNLRPLEGLGVSGELGYRWAPDTGYIVDLDEYFYGKLRTSYRVPIDTLVVVSAFVNGGRGKNDDFSFTAGVGTMPSGFKTKLEYKRWDLSWGATVTSYPVEKVSVYASFFESFSDQNYDMVLSDLPRYYQSSVPIGFTDDGSPDPENRQLSFVLGTHLSLSEDTDADLSYSFTQAKLEYDSGNEPANVQTISNNRSIDAKVHGIRVVGGHWLRTGLRVELGYLLQLFDDGEPRPPSTGSVVRSQGPSDTRHTVTLGVTLTSDLLARSE